MPKHKVSLEIEISKEQARRFLLAHHRLLPPRRLQGKQGVLEYVRHVNCIQYDPINVVGNNAHLVLQSRVHSYKPAMLNEMLYQERTLLDGIDKVMSIYPTEDWPYFGRHRVEMPKLYAAYEEAKQAMRLVDFVRKELKQRGPLSSLDLEDDSRMMYWSNNSTRNVRVALEVLFLGGEAVVHHRVGTRRYYELATRVLAKDLLARANPYHSPKEYLKWHVLRRVGGLGLAQPLASGQWGGMLGTTATERRSALLELVERGDIVRVGIEGLEKQEFYIRRGDLTTLEGAAKSGRGKPHAAFLAALDNFMWDRDLINTLFDFFYRWEVYVPAPKRKWGYYVLPVLYGNRLVARFDPAYDKPNRAFTIQNWWWEKSVNKKDEAMLAALQECMQAFYKYLNAQKVVLGEAAKKDRLVKEILRGV